MRLKCHGSCTPTAEVSLTRPPAEQFDTWTALLLGDTVIKVHVTYELVASMSKMLRMTMNWTRYWYQLAEKKITCKQAPKLCLKLLHVSSVMSISAVCSSQGFSLTLTPTLRFTDNGIICIGLRSGTITIRYLGTHLLWYACGGALQG